MIGAGHAITSAAAFKERKKTSVFIAGEADRGGGVLWRENWDIYCFVNFKKHGGHFWNRLVNQKIKRH